MANQRRGEYALSLFRDEERLGFTVRLTYNGLCDVLSALTQRVGRDYTTSDITRALAAGYVNFVVLRELLFASIRGQHGVYSAEDAGELMERNATKLFVIARTLAGAFNALMPPLDEIEGLAEALREGAGAAGSISGDRGAAGNAEAPQGATGDGTASSASATG